MIYLLLLSRRHKQRIYRCKKLSMRLSQASWTRHRYTGIDDVIFTERAIRCSLVAASLCVQEAIAKMDVKKRDIFPHRSFIRIDVRQCVGCGFCIQACRLGTVLALSKKGRAYVKNVLYCAGCFECLERCPANAIHPLPFNECREALLMLGIKPEGDTESEFDTTL